MTLRRVFTDTDHLKRSLRGAVAIVDDSEGNLKAIDGLTLEQDNSYQGNKLHTIFKDGKYIMKYPYQMYVIC